jgi:hypothetical protein
LSDRDAAAPTLDEVRAAGLLPTWEETQTFIHGLSGDGQGWRTPSALPCSRWSYALQR